MMKSIFLASTVLMAAPVLAQTTAPTPPITQSTPTTDTAPAATPQPATPTSQPAAPGSDTTAAQPTDAQTTPGDTGTGMTAQVDSARAAPAAPSTPPAQASTAPSAPAGAGTQTAAATPQPTNSADAVKTIVDQEWASYDGNTDGNLDAAEFGKWMVALKTKADPSTKAEDPATKTWVSGAFASADTDKSKSVSKAELTGYLSQG